MANWDEDDTHCHHGVPHSKRCTECDTYFRGLACTAHEEQCDPCKNRWALFLGINLECAAALTLCNRMGYARGYDHFQEVDRFVRMNATNHPKVMGFGRDAPLDEAGMQWLVKEY